MKNRKSSRSADGRGRGRPSVATRTAAAGSLHWYIGAAILVLLLCLLAAKKPAKQRAMVSACGKNLPVDISYKDILKSASSGPLKDPSYRCLSNTSVLGYVTPWNSQGYNMAKKYRAKFTHISPVWYQLKRDTVGLSLTGRHDADQDWINDVRQGGSPLIVPRVNIEGWFLESMLLEPSERKQAITWIVEECKEMQYDGVVLEAWSSWASLKILANSQLRQLALEFVKDLGKSLHAVPGPGGRSNLQLLLVIPPIRGEGPEEFKPADLELLQKYVDAFSLMTYDFSSAYNPGPNAPLYWLRACLSWLVPSMDVSSPKKLASKVLMGINFYGNDFVLPRGGGPILGDQFLKLLEQYKPKLVWDAINREHSFDYHSSASSSSSSSSSSHRVYYPTLQSIGVRLQEATSAGAGISIWEIGQGVEYFFGIL